MAHSISTKVAGHTVTAIRFGSEWEVSIDYAQHPPMALCSIYVSEDVRGPLTAAMYAVMEFEATRSPYTGHTPCCEAQNTLDESDCDCQTY
jgi:hypothetical protein